jgi:hypothetical protein
MNISKILSDSNQTKKETKKEELKNVEEEGT